MDSSEAFQPEKQKQQTGFFERKAGSDSWIKSFWIRLSWSSAAGAEKRWEKLA